GALDTRSGAEVMALLQELAEAGHTVILITHDREVAALAWRVIEISDGRIVGDSSRHAGQALQATGFQEIDISLAARHADVSVWQDLREAARTAWRGMCINRGRTALTLLGII